MNFSEEYLYENFKKNYDEAVKAKNAGNLKIAKDRFYKAASFMGKLALVSDGDAREERTVKSERLRAIADAIPADAVTPCYGESEAGGVEEAEGMEQFFTFYTADKLDGGFDCVIGLEKAKEAVTEYVINPIRYPDAYNYKFMNNKAVLLEGPPGTGKTTFAKAVAKEVNQPFALINVAALVNCYVGETGKNIDKVFSFLRSYAEKNKCGITVFFDELDEIAKKRGSDDKASEASVPALLRNLDGVKDNKAFLILANTNRKDVLDSAIAERFRKQVYIPLPDENMRKKLFELKLSDIEDEFLQQLDCGAVSAESEGLSGRDIAFICDDFKYFLSKVKAGLAAEENLQTELSALVSERKLSKDN